MLTLKKSPHRDFIILNISDPQMCEAEWEVGSVTEQMIKRTVGELVSRTNPDLITVTGDLGYPNEDGSYKNLAFYLDSFGIPWAPVMGNHDNQSGACRAGEIADIMTSYSHCVLEKGPTELGVGNYVIKIEEEGCPVTALILMDTHDSFRYVGDNGKSRFSWGEITKPQEEWYCRTVETLSSDGYGENALIIHVPLYNYGEAGDAAFKNGFDFESIMPQDLDERHLNEGYLDTFGVNYEEVSSPSRDCGFFDTLCSVGKTRHVICGHNHTNNSSILYRGVRLTFSCKCGCGSYFDPRVNGGTVMTVGKGGISSIRHEYVDVTDLWNNK